MKLHGLSFAQQQTALESLLVSEAKPTQRNVQKQRPGDRPLPPSRRLLARIATSKLANDHLDSAVLLGIRYALGLVKPDRVAGLSALMRQIESEKKKPEKKAKP